MEAIKSDRTERSMEVSCTTVWNDCLEVIRENVGEQDVWSILLLLIVATNKLHQSLLVILATVAIAEAM